MPRSVSTIPSWGGESVLRSSGLDCVSILWAAHRHIFQWQEAAQDKTFIRWRVAQTPALSVKPSPSPVSTTAVPGCSTLSTMSVSIWSCSFSSGTLALWDLAPGGGTSLPPPGPLSFSTHAPTPVGWSLQPVPFWQGGRRRPAPQFSRSQCEVDTSRFLIFLEHWHVVRRTELSQYTCTHVWALSPFFCLGYPVSAGNCQWSGETS